MKVNKLKSIWKEENNWITRVRYTKNVLGDRIMFFEAKKRKEDKWHVFIHIFFNSDDTLHFVDGRGYDNQDSLINQLVKNMYLKTKFDFSGTKKFEGVF